MPLPLPLAGDTVTQLLLLVAVHAHPDTAVTAIELLPPAEVNDAVVGEIEYVQVTPACVIVTACPPMVTVAVRGLVDAFAAAV